MSYLISSVFGVLKKNERTTLEGKKFLEDMEKILPYDTWIEKYDPYNWDSLQSVWNFESVELSDALSMYFDAFFYSPGQITGPFHIPIHKNIMPIDKIVNFSLFFIPIIKSKIDDNSTVILPLCRNI